MPFQRDIRDDFEEEDDAAERDEDGFWTTASPKNDLKSHKIWRFNWYCLCCVLTNLKGSESREEEDEDDHEIFFEQDEEEAHFDRSIESQDEDADGRYHEYNDSEESNSQASIDYPDEPEPRVWQKMTINL